MLVNSAAHPELLLMALLVAQSVAGAAKPSNDYVEMPADESLNENEKKHAPKVLRVTDDAMEKKRKALADAGIAGAKIKCTVCEQASANISATLAARDFKTELELIEYFSEFCGFRGFPDYLVKEKYWQLKENPKGWYTLEPPTEEQAKAAAAAAAAAEKQGETEWDVVKAAKAVSTACEATVKDSHTELAEFLFTAKKGSKKTQQASMSQLVISKKLCMDMSGACKKRKQPKQSKHRKGVKKEL